MLQPMLLDQDTLKYIFGLKMRGLRLDRGMSLKELAELTGLSPSYLNEIEKGKKYPKNDKVMILANALGESYEELISVKLKRELSLITDLLERNILTGMPFDIFGIPAQSVFELLSERPKKMGALIGTLFEIARAHNISIDDFYYATLRAYLDMHQNFFPNLEEKAEDFRRTYGLDTLAAEERVAGDLQELLRRDYSTDVDYVDFGSINPNLSHILYHVKKKGGRQRLFIHVALGGKERCLILARELGFGYLGLKDRPSSSWIHSLDSFHQLFNHFSASYFASALLVPQKEFADQLRLLFSQPKFDVQAMTEFILKYPCPVESVFHRLTQIIPREIGIDQLFLLRLEYDQTRKCYHVARQLHLAEQHAPHPVSSDEHYCRRWVTTQILEKLQVGEVENFALGCQISQFTGTGSRYLAWSMAFRKDLPKGEMAAVTVGVLINDKSREAISYSQDPKLPVRQTGESCERCSIGDCQERAADYRPAMDPRRTEKVRDALSHI
jgi:transcriptional regulator with XRE-family HTH domain